MAGLGKQAKILSEAQIRAALGHVEQSRYPERDRVMVLLSVKAGMRAKEIASLTWGMLTDAEGEIADVIAVQNGASKGKHGGRTIPLHPVLKEALAALKAMRGDKAVAGARVVHSERARATRPVLSRCGLRGSMRRLGSSAPLAIAAGAPSSPKPRGRSSRPVGH
jgi:integrase